MGSCGRQSCCRSAVSSVDSMGVGKVFIDCYGLIRSRGDDGELDGGWVERQRTLSGRTGFPVIVHVAESRLVGGEGRAVRIWSCYTADDVGSVAVERMEWGIEGVSEGTGHVGLSSGKGGSFEGGWEGGEGAVVIEGAEKVDSYRGDIARVEASGGKTGQCPLLVEVSEKVLSYGSDVARVEAA